MTGSKVITSPASSWEIAQHGRNYVAIINGYCQIEFRGSPFVEQRRAIGAGLNRLRDLWFGPRTFVPPWHQFDWTTVQTLVVHGFDYFNEGRWPLPRRVDGVTLVPTTR